MSSDATPWRLGRYELHERLGHGGMAEVWKALDSQLHRYVAIKILHANLQNDPDFLTRFQREARVMASLHHPNIVQIYDFQIARPPESRSPFAYMVMDYVEGQTLADSIAATSCLGKFPSGEELVRLFISIGLAVDYAHQRGIIHGDIKPANILLDQRNRASTIGEPVLTDFGLVKLLGAPTATLSGFWLGTPHYISPEQAQNFRHTEQSDIYSLGVILYELCTGKVPFQGENAAAIVRQHMNTLPPSPILVNRHLLPAQAMVILRCLAKDPAARFTSAVSLATALAEAFNVPLPEDVSQATYSLDASNDPTYYKPLPPHPSTGTTPPLPLPTKGSSVPPASVALSTPQSIGSAHNGDDVPTTPLNSRAGAPLAPVVQTPLTAAAPPIRHSRKRRRGWYIGLIVLVILMLIGSGLTTLFLFTHLRTAVTPGNQEIGQAFFASSGQLNESNSQGNNDELKIELQNVPTPAPGKSYYAWLLSDKNQAPLKAILLGMLSVDRGYVHFSYPGDKNHTNLLALSSRLLITEENAQRAPPQPSSDPTTWRYSAEIAQRPFVVGKQRTSALSAMRALLYDESSLNALGIQGGLNIRLLKNTAKILEWIYSARDSWDSKNSAFIHRQLVRSLDYLDGQAAVQQDVPPGTLLLVDKVLAQVPLLAIVPNEVPASYIDLIHNELTILISAPDITPTMRTLAIQSDRAILKNVRTWFMDMRQVAKQLVNMTDAQVLQPMALALLDKLVALANYAFVGQLDPSTQAVQQGVVQIFYNIQRLATYTITPYKT
jgi:eukaryotic-like serine/threonine-protein kinase